MSGLPGVSHQPAGDAAGPTGRRQDGMKAAIYPAARRFRRGIELGKEKYAGSWAEYLWHRLDAVDFMNQAVLPAATLLLCAVPFMLIMAALAGRSAVSELSWRLG
jgi:membrane protein